MKGDGIRLSVQAGAALAGMKMTSDQLEEFNRMAQPFVPLVNNLHDRAAELLRDEV